MPDPRELLPPPPWEGPPIPRILQKGNNPSEAPAGARYITWEDFQLLPSFPYIEQAVNFPYDYSKKCSPATKDGHVSVAAIYNMSAWANWKSSSLGIEERGIAEAIEEIPLYELMKLNDGRRSNQPALFPVKILPPGR